MGAHDYFIPAGSDFDPKAPKLSDIYNALNTGVPDSDYGSNHERFRKHFLGEWDWAPKLRQWEEFAKRDTFQDFRPHKITLGFDTAERPERTYEAPLHFFNQIKEQDSMAKAPQTLTYYASLSTDYLTAVTKSTAKRFGLETPQAVIGETLNGLGNNPWVGHVGNLSISHKTDPARHNELALEHLVAAQTVPQLVKAFKSSAAYRAEEANKSFTAMLHQPNYLHVLSAYNETLPNGAQYASWREVQRAGTYTDGALLDFIEKQSDKQVVAKREATYREKRREELAERFSNGDYTYDNISSSTRPAIEHIIKAEIADGALK